MNVIFSLYVDINESDLSKDPKTNIKDKVAKYQFQSKYEMLVQGQLHYARSIGAEYVHFTADSEWDLFLTLYSTKYPYLSHYDIINFYKHYLMLKLADSYKNICYFDLDIIPNTTENIFTAFDIQTSFAVPDSNTDALWGKFNIKKYDHDHRNPATKYWNAHAMLSNDDLDGDQNVYNTGIMIASSDVIKQLDYFGSFDEDMQLMTSLKHDPDSLYPKPIQSVFNYDNETLFSYKVIKNNVKTTLLDNDWHCALKDGMEAPPAKMYHVIDKYFERFFK
jgi:hypothetical protein